MLDENQKTLFEKGFYLKWEMGNIKGCKKKNPHPWEKSIFQIFNLYLKSYIYSWFLSTKKFFKCNFSMYF